jgi:hypothetical protein
MNQYFPGRIDLRDRQALDHLNSSKETFQRDLRRGTYQDTIQAIAHTVRQLHCF